MLTGGVAWRGPGNEVAGFGSSVLSIIGIVFVILGVIAGVLVPAE
ncbi:hypothetical protein [Nonomuraea cypriaca]|nr:hypothetical protein [Nonomuraea cypriaca]